MSLPGEPSLTCNALTRAPERADIDLTSRLLHGPFALLLLMLVAAPLGLGGTQMKVRLASVGEDFDTRLAHWRAVVDAADPAAVPMLFGQGAGHDPAAFLASPGGADEGSSVWGNGTVRLSDSKSLSIAQRLTDWSPGPVEVSVRYPVLQGSPVLNIQIARRPLLVQEYFGSRIDGRVSTRAGGADWQEATVALAGNRLSAPRWYQPRFTVFAVYAGGSDDRVLELDSIRLVDAAGRNLLSNDGFENGGADRAWAPAERAATSPRLAADASVRAAGERPRSHRLRD